MRAWLLAGLTALWLSGCGNPQPAGPAAYKVVLVAGDAGLPVFDNAAGAMRDALLARGLTDNAAILSFPSAKSRGGPKDVLLPVLHGIATLRPQAGQGCLVFATSHGVRNAGLYLSAGPAVLTPADLDFALTLGCHNAPTVVIASGCFSGQFARAPMTAPNRIILTASRADRTSFGCAAGRDFTVFDQCLIGSMRAVGGWRALYRATSACVAEEEGREHVRPSAPQFVAGPAAGPDAFPHPGV